VIRELTGLHRDAATAQMLQRAAGNRATARLLARRPTRAPRVKLARLGQRLDVPLDPTAEQPAFGEDTGKQRRWSRAQYEAMWESEQGTKLTAADEHTIEAGCIGITENNLGVLDRPFLAEAYSTFDKAHSIAESRNGAEGRFAPRPWVVFAVHFWSNQDPDEEKRKNTDPSAFLPDADGKVDMTGYKFLAQPGFTNFDFAFWDDASNSHWHANHCDAARKDCKVDNDMQVFQSTRAVFSATFTGPDGATRYEYPDFDREVFAVERARHYDPSRAAKRGLTAPILMGPDGAPDPVFQKIFDRKRKLQKGARGKHIKVIQQALVDQGDYDLGTFGPNGDGVDSVFGSKTADAVKKFKVDFNLFGPALSDIDKGVIAELDNLNTVPF
jgi:hypothetical protein